MRRSQPKIDPAFQKRFLDRVRSGDPVKVELIERREIPKVTIEYWLTRLIECGAVKREQVAHLFHSDSQQPPQPAGERATDGA